MKLNKKEIKILAAVIAVWGVVMISSGITMSFNKRTITKVKYSLDVSTKQISQVQAKKNEVILRDLEVEQGYPISVNVRDYLQNVEQISDEVISQLNQGLDTSLVNVNQAGTYTYTITYRKKRYQGRITVKEKELPKVKIILKAKKLPTTGTLSRNIRDYIYEDEELTEEAYNNMILDLEEVAAHLSIPGRYKYKVIYNDTTYYGDFDIVQPVTTGTTPMVCPNESTKDNNTCICTEPNKVYDEKTNTCISKQ